MQKFIQENSHILSVGGAVIIVTVLGYYVYVSNKTLFNQVKHLEEMVEKYDGSGEVYSYIEELKDSVMALNSRIQKLEKRLAQPKELGSPEGARVLGTSHAQHLSSEKGLKSPSLPTIIEETKEELDALSDDEAIERELSALTIVSAVN